VRGTAKKIGIVLGAGVVAVLVFAVALLGLLLLADHFRASNSLEPWLIVSSFLKPILLVPVGTWLWLVGRWLEKGKLAKLGLSVLIIWLIAAIVPYVLSFGITPDG
jgi:hypothetical protein